MTHQWPDGVLIEFFSPVEFDHPRLMDTAFVLDLSGVRERCGFPLRITSSVRLYHDMERIYGRPFVQCPDSAHVYRAKGTYKLNPNRRILIPCDLDDSGAQEYPEYKVRCADLKPAHAETKQEREEKEMALAWELLNMWKEGRWECCQWELATLHQHGDDYTWPGRIAVRPNIFPGVSK